MNNFTKDELEDLRDCIHAAYLSGKINPQVPLRTKDKIQSMIDNCCKHKWSTPDLLNIPFRCVKCGVKNE